MKKYKCIFENNKPSTDFKFVLDLETYPRQLYHKVIQYCGA